ncbi:hypothetical protein OFC03_30395, partial [Escherichia coli]|nr:hypothetical protein [Escherichia coli]
MGALLEELGPPWEGLMEVEEDKEGPMAPVAPVAAAASAERAEAWAARNLVRRRVSSVRVSIEPGERGGGT